MWIKHEFTLRMSVCMYVVGKLCFQFSDQTTMLTYYLMGWFPKNGHETYKNIVFKGGYLNKCMLF